MHKPIAIVAGEPNSISSEIIFKSWKLRKNFTHKPFIIIGSADMLNLQMKKLKYHIKIKKIKSNFNLKDLKGNELPVYNVEYRQKNPFEKISNKSNKYILKCLNLAVKFINQKKIIGFINCPIAKESLFQNKQQGITEFLAKKAGKNGSEAMLLFNKKLSVSPLTTHIPLKDVSRKLTKSQIIKKTKTISHFFKKILKKKPKFAILGFNPHSFSLSKNSEEKKIILPAIKAIKKSGIKVTGPVSPDTSFMFFKENKFNVILGMYHDQVLTPFKTLFKYEAINITLGLPYIRVSPDHGVANNIMGKNLANPKSLIESIRFFNNIK